MRYLLNGLYRAAAVCIAMYLSFAMADAPGDKPNLQTIEKPLDGGNSLKILPAQPSATLPPRPGQSPIVSKANPPQGAAQTTGTGGSKLSDDQPGKYSLRYRFAAGDVLRSKVVQQTRIETTIAGTTQTADMTSISTKAWRVTGVDDRGRITFDTMIENIDMRQQMSGRQEVRYNSQTDKKAPPGYESAAESVGKLLTSITMDNTGRLLKREKKEQTNVDNSNAQIVVPMPDGAVAVGDHWSVPVDVTITLENKQTKAITTKHRYELDKIENGIAVISVETILPPINDPKVRAQLIQRLTRGVIRFDIQAGRVISQRTDLDERVIGFNGPDSSLHYLGRFTEELLPVETKTAGQRPQAK